MIMVDGEYDNDDTDAGDVGMIMMMMVVVVVMMMAVGC